MQRNRLEIQSAIQVDGCNNVSFCVLIQRTKNRSLKGITHCNVGTIPLTPAPAPGVAAGVAGVTTLPAVAEASWPYPDGPALLTPFLSSVGGVRSPAPPGKDKEDGAVNALACRAFWGWVLNDSMEAMWV